MPSYVTQLFELTVGIPLEFEAPEGCDGYPHTCEPVATSGPLGSGVFLALVWRKSPPPIVDPPPKPAKAKRAKP